jgi:hypothetical protein
MGRMRRRKEWEVLPICNCRICNLQLEDRSLDTFPVIQLQIANFKLQI